MINLRNSDIKKWLSAASVSHSADYCHQLLVENRRQRVDAIRALKSIVHEAHQDTKEYLRQCTEEDLDPFGNRSTPSIADAYPSRLHLKTKKAYFGEIMAGLVAENFATGPGNWRVLTFLFGLHELAFYQLELWRQTGRTPKHVPGQQGEDCVAFYLDDLGVVKASLVCEGKCTNDHDSSMISDAHRSLSSPLAKPVSLLRIIKILRDHPSDPEAKSWVNILLRLYNRNDAGYRRFDLVSYTCGRRPVKSASWIALNKPHVEYSGNRHLESVEIHLTDVDELVEEVYRE